MRAHFSVPPQGLEQSTGTPLHGQSATLAVSPAVSSLIETDPVSAEMWKRWALLSDSDRQRVLALTDALIT
ncbi:hypothetical protein [Novipirellula caenicola]